MLRDTTLPHLRSLNQEPLIFDDVAIYFTLEEWRSLEEWQKELYKEVMLENYHALQSLGIPVVKSELLLLIEGGEEPCVQGHPRWEELGCEPKTVTGWQSHRDAAELAPYDGVWLNRRPPMYRRRVLRKRSGRRSPNFSRVELECFVSLMDRYLPDELQRAGAISLRQRRAILQEIARCLEPMSGCLRTPRQLLHRWADFNNRDPERLMEIRMQLLYAASCEQSWDSSDVQIAPSPAGRRWRRKISRPLSSSSSSCSEDGDESLEDSLWDEGLSESSIHYFPVSPDPPLRTPLVSHIDAQGHYLAPSPIPKSEERRWQLGTRRWMEEPGGFPEPEERIPGRASSAPLYSAQYDKGLRTIKSEPDSEEDEGGGSWSNDVPSPESVMSSRNHRRKGGEGNGTEQRCPNSVSPEDSYPWMETPPDGHPLVKLESDLSDPCTLESQTWSEQEDSSEARSIRRSPNFSAAELEHFVALMDHFLPDNLIRAGAIPIRQRKSILQEIARRLEPLSGCLRTPRQLRHRWTDFNNRDPDRLEEIRSRLRRAARLQSCKKLSKAAEAAPAAGKKWRLRRHRPQRDITQEEQTPVQMRLDTSEEHTPRIPWHQSGLPKPRNSFSMARLKNK
ncbi:uncharacterized protein LOC142243730 isoform X1 [Anomaloglossus baeobatrachus]|uniref:uncharacterized protein LOC142243730 isoform X1 n=2 Tax=Anomaloglossus baeobatrachus TaxID=238106 RepID=UPI003F4FACBB